MDPIFRHASDFISFFILQEQLGGNCPGNILENTSLDFFSAICNFSGFGSSRCFSCFLRSTVIWMNVIQFLRPIPVDLVFISKCDKRNVLCFTDATPKVSRIFPSYRSPRFDFQLTTEITWDNRDWPRVILEPIQSISNRNSAMAAHSLCKYRFRVLCSMGTSVL